MPGGHPDETGGGVQAAGEVRDGEAVVDDDGRENKQPGVGERVDDLGKRRGVQGDVEGDERGVLGVLREKEK